MNAPSNEISKVWIAGSGRSGTTWFSRMLTAVRGSKIIHEPLHPDHVSLPDSIRPYMDDVDIRPYLRSESESKEWATFIDELYAGTYQNWWTRFGGVNKRSIIPEVWFNSLFANRVVVKSIRSHLILGWLSRNPNYKVVHIMRHPCATLLSQQQRDWGVNLSLFTRDEALHTDYLQQYDDYLQQDFSDLSGRAARWAIENGVPLKQARNGEAIYLITYEDLVCDPLGEIQRLLKFLDWQIDEDQWKRIEARVQVGFASPKDPKANPDKLSNWTRKFSSEQVDEVLKTVHALGVDIYDEDIMPKLEINPGSHRLNASTS